VYKIIKSTEKLNTKQAFISTNGKKRQKGKKKDP